MQAVGAEQEEVVVVLVVVGVSGDMERGLDTAVAAAAERLVAALQVRVEVVQRRHNRRRGFMYGGRRGGEEERRSSARNWYDRSLLRHAKTCMCV